MKTTDEKIRIHRANVPTFVRRTADVSPSAVPADCESPKSTQQTVASHQTEDARGTLPVSVAPLVESFRGQSAPFLPPENAVVASVPADSDILLPPKLRFFGRETKSGRAVRTIPKVALIAVIVAVTLASVGQFLHHFAMIHYEPSHFLQLAGSVFLLFLSWQLYTRKRLAWVMYLGITAFDAVISYSDLVACIMFRDDHGTEYEHEIQVMMISATISLVVDLAVVSLLLLFRRSFRRRVNRKSLRFALIPLALAGLAFWYTAVLVLHNDVRGALEVLLLGGQTPFQDFLHLFFWLSLIAMCGFLLRTPITDVPLSLTKKRAVRDLCLKHGQNPTAYLALEDDKLLYLGKNVEGVVAYGIVESCIVVLGDPICADCDFARLLAEFRAFCQRNAYECIFLGATDKYLPIYDILGFGHTKCGEEARFRLANYGLSGKKMAKMRMNVNHAVNAGLTVSEYKPTLGKDRAIEDAFRAISREWLDGKKSGELGFCLGSVGLDNPMDRRYFYAKNPEGQIVAFNVYLPFLGKDGMMADITRRAKDCPGGATEKIMYDAFVTFRDEGIAWASMGLAPLASIKEEGATSSLTTKALAFVADKGERFYGFADLHRAKHKYAPTDWVPGYFIYTGKNITPQMAYAVARIQSKRGLFDTFIKEKIAAHRRVAAELHVQEEKDLPLVV